MQNYWSSKFCSSKFNPLNYFSYSREVEDQGLSRKVLEDVIEVTRYNALKKLGSVGRSTDIPKKETPIQQKLSTADESTLNLLKAMAFSNCTSKERQKGLKYAEMAVTAIAKCPSAHYMYGSHLTMAKSDESSIIQHAFEKAYELSKNASLGMHLVMYYKKKEMSSEVERMCSDIMETCPKSGRVCLDIAQEYVHLKKYEAAESCLNCEILLQPKKALLKRKQKVLQIIRKKMVKSEIFLCVDGKKIKYSVNFIFFTLFVVSITDTKLLFKLKFHIEQLS